MTTLSEKRATSAHVNDPRVDVPELDRQEQQPVGQGQVGAGLDLQVQRRRGGGRRTTGVHDDQRPAGRAHPGEVLHHRRHRLGQVAPDQQDGTGRGDVGQRERHPAVQPEGPHRACRGRAHAEAPVVVDLARPQSDPGELAQQVSLLVGQAAASEDPDRVRTGQCLRGAEAVGGAVQGLLPARLPQRAVPAVPDQRGREPARRVQQRRRGPALAAEPALAGLHDCGACRGREGHGALQRAVRAVGGHRRGRQQAGAHLHTVLGRDAAPVSRVFRACDEVLMVRAARGAPLRVTMWKHPGSRGVSTW